MPDKKVTAMTANSTPQSTDLLMLIDDPSGSPQNQKVTVTDLLGVVSLEHYGVNTTPGTTDMLSAFNDMITVAKTMTAPKVVIPAGIFYVSGTVVFDLPDDSTIEWVGTVTTDLSNATAIQFGDTASQTQRLKVLGGVNIDRTTDDTTGTSKGIEIRRCTFWEVHVYRATGFRTNIEVSGVGGGNSHGHLYLHHVHDGHVNLRFTADSSGFCNEHAVYGGSLSYSTGYAGEATAVHLEIDFNTSAELNNIVFYKPSFEGLHASTKVATIEGNNICIIHPRIENSGDQANFEIEFTSNSQECCILGKGFSIASTNITDGGANNIFYTRNGAEHDYQVAAATDDRSAGSDDACHQVSSSSSNAAVGYRTLDTSGNVMFVASTGGRVFSNDRAYFQNGIRWVTSSGYNDRGLFSSTGTPEGSISALIGSFYSRTDGGVGTTLYVKESGTGNTGWVASGNKSETVTATNVITAIETGTTFYLNTAGGFTSTLPAPAAGLKYTFIVSTAPTTAYIVTTNSGSNLLYGTVIDIVGELVYFSTMDQVNFAASTSVVGDRLEVESDGTNWYCKAISGADGGITVTVT